MFNNSHLFFLLFLILCFSTCKLDKKEQILELSDTQVDLNWISFEQELFSLDTNNMSQALESLSKKYPAFSDLFFNRVLVLNVSDQSSYENELLGFIKDERIVKLKDTTDIVFKDLNALKSAFKTAFTYYQHYFPDKSVPDIYTFISEYGYQRFLFEVSPEKDGIGIGLDMFLGADYPYRRYLPDNPSFSDYMTRSFNKDHVVKKVMETMIEDLMPDKGTRLIDQMIANGKKLYLLEKILPTTPDSVIMEYTPTQLDWIRNNETELWAYLFKQELFYSANMNDINKLVNPSPNAPGMPPEAPGRTANYLGWQIVKNYMERNPDESINELFVKDPQDLLEESKFKPRKKR